MTDFPTHTIDSAPEASRDALRRSEASYGTVPNLHGTLAESPEALAMYQAGVAALAATDFTPAEQQLLYLAINYENDCTYCMAGHSRAAARAGLSPDAIEALREGTPIADLRLQALREFASEMTVKRGGVGDAAVERFLAAGFERRQVLDVILAIATKTLSNYTNHVARTPNDAFMAATAWTHPNNR